MSEARRLVLLVDDDEPSRTALAWLLEDAGFEVEHAASLREGRAKLSSMCTGGAVPSLVVVDVHLGDGLGTALLPDVRRLAPRAKTAVISGAADLPDLAGADLSMTKADEPARAIAALARLVSDT